MPRLLLQRLLYEITVTGSCFFQEWEFTQRFRTEQDWWLYNPDNHQTMSAKFLPQTDYQIYIAWQERGGQGGSHWLSHKRPILTSYRSQSIDSSLFSRSANTKFYFIWNLQSLSYFFTFFPWVFFVCLIFSPHSFFSSYNYWWASSCHSKLISQYKSKLVTFWPKKPNLADLRTFMNFY